MAFTRRDSPNIQQGSYAGCWPHNVRSDRGWITQIPSQASVTDDQRAVDSPWLLKVVGRLIIVEQSWDIEVEYIIRVFNE